MTDWTKLYKTNLVDLNRSQLKAHINDLKTYRLDDKSTQFSSNELNILLLLAINEQGSRSTKMLSIISIIIAVLSIIISAIGVWHGGDA